MADPQFFDTHCHLDDEQFDSDREAIIASLAEQGIAWCMTVGSDLTSSEMNIRLAGEHSGLYAAAGVHPHAAAQAPTDYLSRLEPLLSAPKVRALGEIGLDFHYDFSPRDIQRQLLSEQLDLAYRLSLPAILHVRDAHGEMIDLLRARQGRLAGGVIHCFSGSLESACEYLRLGLMISFAGSLTFKNARRLHEAAAGIPLESILIETDSPYLAPVPMRGRRNQPAYVRHTCAFLAELRGISLEEAAQATCDNAKRLFRIN